MNACAPPPTFNTLDSRQRTRLIRSTRKLGAVLGTTPQLVECDRPLSPPTTSAPQPPPCRPKHDRKRRQGSIFDFAPSAPPFTYDYASSSASSSASSLALSRSSLDSDESAMSTHSLPTLPTPKSFARHVREKSRSKGKRAPLPTPLVLRLNAVPLPPSDPRVQPITPDTAATLKTATLAPPSASALPLTPTTPHTPSTPTATETRRKRLAKLKRTLGENVPAELIAPLRAIRTQRTSPVDPPPAPVLLSPPSAPFRQPKSRAQPYATLRTPTQPHRPLVSAFIAPKSATSPRKRSLSVDFKHGVVSPALFSAPATPPKPPPKTPRDRSHSRSPSHVPARRAETDDSGPERHAHGWVTGAETWTGEWNRRDIREVQHQLRNLKLR